MQLQIWPSVSHVDRSGPAQKKALNQGRDESSPRAKCADLFRVSDASTASGDYPIQVVTGGCDNAYLGHRNICNHNEAAPSTVREGVQGASGVHDKNGRWPSTSYYGSCLMTIDAQRQAIGRVSLLLAIVRPLPASIHPHGESSFIPKAETRHVPHVGGRRCRDFGRRRLRKKHRIAEKTTYLDALVMKFEAVGDTTREHVADLGAIATLLAPTLHPPLLMDDAAFDDPVADGLPHDVFRILFRVQVEFHADIPKRDP